MRLEDDTYEYIKQEVTDLFKRYHIRSIPIVGFEIAAKMGISIIPYNALSSSK